MEVVGLFVKQACSVPAGRSSGLVTHSSGILMDIVAEEFILAPTQCLAIVWQEIHFINIIPTPTIPTSRESNQRYINKPGAQNNEIQLAVLREEKNKQAMIISVSFDSSNEVSKPCSDIGSFHQAQSSKAKTGAARCQQLTFGRPRQSQSLARIDQRDLRRQVELRLAPGCFRPAKGKFCC